MPDAIIFIERHVAPQIKVNIPVKYHLLEDQAEIKTILEGRKKDRNARAMDTGLGGMQISSERAFKEGDVLNLEITLPGLSEILLAFAEVVWADKKVGGLHFLKISEEDLNVMKAYLRKAGKSR